MSELPIETMCADAAAGKRSIDVIYETGPELKKFAADVEGAGNGKPIAVAAAAVEQQQQQLQQQQEHHQPPQSSAGLMIAMHLPMVAENVLGVAASHGEFVVLEKTMPGILTMFLQSRTTKRFMLLLLLREAAVLVGVAENPTKRIKPNECGRFDWTRTARPPGNRAVARRS
jgi:hypothetical protein